MPGFRVTRFTVRSRDSLPSLAMAPVDETDALLRHVVVVGCRREPTRWISCVYGSVGNSGRGSNPR